MTNWRQKIISGANSAIGSVRSKTSASYHYEKYYYRFEQYQKKERGYLAQVEVVQTDLDNLVAIRVQAQEVSKQAVAFLGNASLKERNLNPDFVINPIKLERLNLTNEFDVIKNAKTLFTSGRIGLGVSQLTLETVGMFGKASTGTPIRNLTGAARDNAIFAKLGGGTKALGGGGVSRGKLVSGGIAVTTAVGLMMASQVEKTIKTANQVHKAIAEIDIHEAKIERTLIEL